MKHSSGCPYCSPSNHFWSAELTITTRRRTVPLVPWGYLPLPLFIQSIKYTIQQKLRRKLRLKAWRDISLTPVLPLMELVRFHSRDVTVMLDWKWIGFWIGSEGRRNQCQAGYYFWGLSNEWRERERVCDRLRTGSIRISIRTMLTYEWIGRSIPI